MILVLLSSMVPYILPHAWLGEHYPGYYFYMFKGMAWTLKLALLIFEDREKDFSLSRKS